MKRRILKYALHKATGQAPVRIDRKTTTLARMILMNPASVTMS